MGERSRRQVSRFRPRPSTLIAFAALAIAVGGSAYAITLPRSSVGTRHLKKGAVTSPKIKDRTIRRPDIAPGTLSVGRSVTSYPAGDIDLEDQYSTMIDLESAHDSGGNKRLTTTSRSRILATGTIDIYTDSAAAASGICKLTITDGGGTSRFSQEHEFDFPASQAYDITVQVSGGVVKPAGTYDVDVECAGDGTDLNSADLIVWTVPM